MTVLKISFFKHKVGDGLHYINDKFVIFENGQYQDGETSDSCVILNLQKLCTYRGLPPVWDLWTAAYPEDPLDEDDAARMFSEAAPFTEPCDISNLSIQEAILEDVEAIGLSELANRINVLLSSKR